MASTPRSSEGAQTFANARWLHADERGSIVGVSNAAGALELVRAYSTFGQPSAWPGAGSSGAGAIPFGYTGQLALASAQLWHYKARAYHPLLGRFTSPDPLGYAAGDMNLYAYVGNDPLNHVDPLGLEIVVKGRRQEFSPNGSDLFVANVFLDGLLDARIDAVRAAVAAPKPKPKPKPKPRPQDDICLAATAEASIGIQVGGAFGVKKVLRGEARGVAFAFGARFTVQETRSGRLRTTFYPFEIFEGGRGSGAARIDIGPFTVLDIGGIVERDFQGVVQPAPDFADFGSLGASGYLGAGASGEIGLLRECQE